MPSKGKVDMFVGSPLPIKISITYSESDLVNGKGKDISNEIYSWLLVCQVRTLEDVALQPFCQMLRCCIITSLELLKKCNLGWILKMRNIDIMHLKRYLGFRFQCLWMIILWLFTQG